MPRPPGACSPQRVLCSYKKAFQNSFRVHLDCRVDIFGMGANLDPMPSRGSSITYGLYCGDRPFRTRLRQRAILSILCYLYCPFDPETFNGMCFHVQVLFLSWTPQWGREHVRLAQRTRGALTMPWTNPHQGRV